MRLGCLLPIAAIGLIIGGVQGIWTAVHNREPKTLTVEAYLATKPPEKWLRLTDGISNFAGLTYTKSIGTGEATELFLPLQPPHKKPGDKVRILVATKDSARLEAYNHVRNLALPETLKYIAEHQDQFQLTGPFEGLVRSGIDSDSKQERKLREANPDLAEEFVILDQGKKPEPLLSVIYLVAGLGLGVVWLVWQARSSDNSPPLNPPPLPPPPPPPPSFRDPSPPLRQ